MDAIAIGPLVFSSERLTAILSLGLMVALAELLARRVDRRFSGWGWWGVIVFAVTARLGHVLQHMPAFADNPLRALAFWQGGFHVTNGVIGLIVFTLIWFRGQGRLLRWALLPGGAAAGLALWMGLSAPGLPPTALPSNSYPVLDGPDLVPASLTGQPVVVNLWATWCPPCRREMPMLAQVARARDDVVFLFVNQREDERIVRNYIQIAGVAPPNMLLDRAGFFARHYATLGLPVTMFVGRDGVLRALHVGEISRERLEEGIATVLRE